MITADDVLTTCGKHTDRLDWVSPAVERNAIETADKVTALLVRFGKSRILTSGFRDLDSNKLTPGSAPYSRHLYGQAVDIEDIDKELSKFATVSILEELGLWMEDPKSTSSWCHVQTMPPRSGARVFSK